VLLGRRITMEFPHADKDTTGFYPGVIAAWDEKKQVSFIVRVCVWFLQYVHTPMYTYTHQLHRTHFDDGDKHWRNLAERTWKFEGSDYLHKELKPGTYKKYVPQSNFVAYQPTDPTANNRATLTYWFDPKLLATGEYITVRGSKPVFKGFDQPGLKMKAGSIHRHLYTLAIDMPFLYGEKKNTGIFEYNFYIEHPDNPAKMLERDRYRPKEFRSLFFNKYPATAIASKATIYNLVVASEFQLVKKNEISMRQFIVSYSFLWIALKPTHAMAEKAMFECLTEMFNNQLQLDFYSLCAALLSGSRGASESDETICLKSAHRNRIHQSLFDVYVNELRQPSLAMRSAFLAVCREGEGKKKEDIHIDRAFMLRGPIFAAARLGFPRMLTSLLAMGCVVDTTLLQEALELATQQPGGEACVSLLMQHGACVEVGAAAMSDAARNTLSQVMSRKVDGLYAQLSATATQLVLAGMDTRTHELSSIMADMLIGEGGDAWANLEFPDVGQTSTRSVWVALKDKQLALERFHGSTRRDDSTRDAKEWSVHLTERDGMRGGLVDSIEAVLQVCGQVKGSDASPGAATTTAELYMEWSDALQEPCDALRRDISGDQQQQESDAALPLPLMTVGAVATHITALCTEWRAFVAASLSTLLTRRDTCLSAYTAAATDSLARLHHTQEAKCTAEEAKDAVLRTFFQLYDAQGVLNDALSKNPASLLRLSTVGLSRRVLRVLDAFSAHLRGTAGTLRELTTGIARCRRVLTDIDTVSRHGDFIDEARERFGKYDEARLALEDELDDAKTVIRKSKRKKQEVTPAMKQAVQEKREGLAQLSRQHWKWTQSMGSSCTRFAAEFLCEGFYSAVLGQDVLEEPWCNAFMRMVRHEGLENVHRSLQQFSNVSVLPQAGAHEVLLGEIDGQRFALKKFQGVERKQMLHESMMLKNLQHVYIGDVVCFFQDEYKGDPCYYVQMPFYGGGTLQQRIESKEWFQSIPLIRHVCAQLLRALKYLHGRNVSHGDIKPSNIFFTDFEEGKLPMTKLGDLGASDASENLTMALPRHTTVAWQVTQNYAAPELVVSPRARKTPASDMYSLGLLVGDLVFSDLNRSDVRKALPLLEKEGSEGVPHCPQLAALLRLLLDEDPSQRITAAAACKHPFFVVSADAGQSSLLVLQALGETVVCSGCGETRHKTQCTGCEVLGDADQKDQLQTLQLSEKHWLCHVAWEEGADTCFDGFIQTCMEDSKVSISGTAGLPCCGTVGKPEAYEGGDPERTTVDCGRVFPEASFRQRVCNEDVWSAYGKARVRHIESAVNRGKDEEIKRLLGEWAKLDKHDRAVRGYQQHIEMHILTSRCPKSHPFHDFTGCFALSCAPPCNARFCGYCLADCGTNSHPHVSAKGGNGVHDWTCPVKKAVRSVTRSQDPYYGDMKEFKMATTLRVVAKMEEYLPTVPIEILVDVLDARCQQLIADIIGQGELDKLIKAM
jgi:serine/threonine protein kinase